MPCSRIRRLNIVKMAVLPKLIYRFNLVPIRISVGCFVESDRLILKFKWKLKGSKIAKMGFPGGAVVENLPANAGDTGSSPGPGRSHMPWSN